jgi:hypothetical protein
LKNAVWREVIEEVSIRAKKKSSKYSLVPWNNSLARVGRPGMTRVNGGGSLFIHSRREAGDANSMLRNSSLVNAERVVAMASGETVR